MATRKQRERRKNRKAHATRMRTEYRTIEQDMPTINEALPHSLTRPVRRFIEWLTRIGRGTASA